jgi:hypothetical protein
MTMPTSFALPFPIPLPSASDEQRLLPIIFVPSKNDVICKKGRKAFDHVGNRRFRVLLQLHTKRYDEAANKTCKPVIVNEIVDMICESSSSSGGAGFIRYNNKSNRWYEISDAMAREKVGFTLREELRKQDGAYMEEKRRKRRTNKRARTAVRNMLNKQVIAEAIKESDNFIRQTTFYPPPQVTESSLVAAARLPTATDLLSDDWSLSSSDDEDECQPLQMVPFAAANTLAVEPSMMGDEMIPGPPKLLAGESRAWFDEDQMKLMNQTMNDGGFDHATFFGGESQECPRRGYATTMQAV